jgi:hypothetical protein
MIKRIIITSVIAMASTLGAQAQTLYDSKTLVDTNNNSTSTSTVNTNNTSTSTSTATSTSTVNSTNTNTNNNVMSGTVTYNNNNVNSGTMTYNNNNASTSTSTNTNNNVNTGDMTNRNINTSTSTSSNVNTNTNNNVNLGDMTNRNVQSGGLNNTNANTNTNINTGDMTNRNINDTTMRVVQPPPTAIAPAMMSGGNNDLCTTGTSGSVQTQIFGVSSGGTVRDMNCERLKLSKTLYDMGMKVAAVSTMCQDRRVFDAMMAAGTPCPVEGKIGEHARAYWESNPDKLPKLEEPKEDDTYKKVGIGSILGIAMFKLFGL